MQSNQFFQSTGEEEPLNGVQKLLLGYTREDGMTATLLRSWVKHPKGFTAAHGETVHFLVKKMGMLPSAAIREVDGLSEKEVALFPKYFLQGINRKYILANRHQLFFDGELFAETLALMIKKKVPLTQALLELADLYEGEIMLLHDYYRYGLRGPHLKEAKLDDVYQTYVQFKMRKNDAACQDALRYFNKIFRITNRSYSPLTALREAGFQLMKIEQDALSVSGKVTSKRIKFLLHGASEGIRADDYPAEYSAEQKKTYHLLRWWFVQTKEEAVIKMYGLSDDKMAYMRRYFGHGINHDKLRAFPHHADYLFAVIKRFGWGADQSLDYLSALTNEQVQYLHHLAEYGVTMKDVQALTPQAIYSEMRKDVAVSLICEHAMHPSDALNIVASEPEDELAVLLQRAESVKPAL